MKVSAINTLTIEADAITSLIDRLDQSFNDAVSFIFQSKGRLIITGMGKSGVIGMKLTATFSSTGTPSFFLHPAEAIHGDLGMLQPDDVVLALSYSGETDELLKIVPFLKDYSSGLVAMTGNANSTLARAANLHIDVKVAKEACPNNLAPTASTTATLAMGDALAIAVMELRNFKPEQFARYHPGGSLGRKLLTKVADIMHSKNLPIVSADTPIKEVVQAMSNGRMGLVIVRQNGSSPTGIITDGDLRRAMENKEDRFFRLKAENIMTSNAKTIKPDIKLSEAEQMMNELKISALIVQDNNEIHGVVQIFDIQ
ncbi:KpsF/GutQ family sugar-phosphate isomerase [Rhodohalobacter barkolensis]|nr:KpsF/GutQ family sugar-phosphate isomerase [Rhodohalobacter barkolensis]